MNSSPTSGSDRRLDRNKGLARISALTLGVGAAGLVGAVAIAVTLPGSTVATQASSTGASALTSGSTTTNDDGSTSRTSGDEGSASQSQSQSQSQPQSPPQSQPQSQSQLQSQLQLQSAAAPSRTNRPPVATSGAS